MFCYFSFNERNNTSWIKFLVQMMWRLVHSSWILHVNCNKRRVAPIAALLSSVLHSSVFCDEGMHIKENSPGPLKWVCGSHMFVCIFCWLPSICYIKNMLNLLHLLISLLQFVEKILEEGSKSPRTIRLAALHLTGLWLSNPRIIKYYLKELKLLTLYGSGASKDKMHFALSWLFSLI